MVSYRNGEARLKNCFEGIKKMVRVGEKPRGKPLLISLYESGARIGEFLDLKIKTQNSITTV